MAGEGAAAYAAITSKSPDFSSASISLSTLGLRPQTPSLCVAALGEMRTVLLLADAALWCRSRGGLDGETGSGDDSRGNVGDSASDVFSRRSNATRDAVRCKRSLVFVLARPAGWVCGIDSR